MATTMRGANKDQPFRIGLLAGYMSLFDDVMGPDFQSNRLRWAERLREVISTQGEVVFPGLIANWEDAERAQRIFRDWGTDVIVAAPTMASPPGYSWSIVNAFPNLPIIVWAVHALGAMPDDFDHRALTHHSATVGAVMLTNTLLRNGRKFHMVVGHVEDAECKVQLEDLLGAAKVVAQLKQARLGVIGPPIEAYDDVVVDEAALKRDIGPTLVVISKEELADYVRSVTADQIMDVKEEVHARYQIESVPVQDLHASLRLAAGLRNLCEDQHLAGGAINCRTDTFAYNPDVASLGCFAVSYLTTEGRPFTCAGDVVTAVAMLLTKWLGGESFYHEWDMIDYERRLIWLANTGESDCNLADPSHPVCLIASQGHSGQLLPGTSLFHHLRPGSATIVGFSPNKLAPKGWSIVWAEGEIIGTKHAHCRVPNGLFSLKSGCPQETFRRWCMGGAAHHASLSSGHFGTKLHTIADMLGIGAYPA